MSEEQIKDLIRTLNGLRYVALDHVDAAESLPAVQRAEAIIASLEGTLARMHRACASKVPVEF